MSTSNDQRTNAGELSLAGMTTLGESLETTDDLTLEERHQLVDQAVVFIEQLYVHLPLKRAIHAIDPIQRLKLLKHRLHTVSERRFHDEMLSIFTRLRDLHTSYALPAPYHGKRAVTGFRIQRYVENGERRYIVTEVDPRIIDDPYFKPGVLVTHWNGVPIARAVDLNADRQAGSNADARHARGLATMTVRPLWLTATPDEEWVTISYTSEDRERREIRLNWRVVVPPPPPNAVVPDSVSDPLALTLGIDALVEAVQRTRKMLFAPQAMETERQVVDLYASGALEGAEPGPNLARISTMPDVLQFRTVSTSYGAFGYLRIWTFDVNPDAFVAEVVHIIEMLPQNGLIVDVRGNPGGRIPAGERLLQIFTPRRIEPERLHFINTPLTLRLCQQNPGFEDWRESIAQSVETAATFSDGFPVLPGEAENCNRLGQRYHGPVVLITDAMCYSTTDFFAAGWQDHEIGSILGTDGNTGAGGANVFEHWHLMDLLPPGTGSPIQPLPKGTTLRVSIRRSTRVGARSGVPVEDLGVVPDRIHNTTREDVLNDNEDLIENAASMLAEKLPRTLTAEVKPATDGRLGVSVITTNISRLDAYLDGRPQLTLDVEDGTATFELPGAHSSSRILELRGFDGDVLVAARRIEL